MGEQRERERKKTVLLPYSAKICRPSANQTTQNSNSAYPLSVCSSCEGGDFCRSVTASIECRFFFESFVLMAASKRGASFLKGTEDPFAVGVALV